MAEGLQPSSPPPPAPPPRISPPHSPDFHGFGRETHFPKQLILEIEGEGDEEKVVKVTRRQKNGRPNEGWEKEDAISKENILPEHRRSIEQESSRSLEIVIPSSSSSPLSSKALPKKIPGTSSRHKVFLFDKLDPTFK